MGRISKGEQTYRENLENIERAQIRKLRQNRRIRLNSRCGQNGKQAKWVNKPNGQDRFNRKIDKITAMAIGEID